MKNVFFSVVVVLLAGCALGPDRPVHRPPQQYFKDDLFNDIHTINIESENDIFVLSPEAKQFVDTAVRPTDKPKKQVNDLVKALFEMDSLGLVYDNAATATASETFKRGYANCISMTILAYSMSQHAGLHPQFVSVEVPEFWTRRDGFSLLNGHVNLRVYLDRFKSEHLLQSRFLTIDFDPQEIRRHFYSRTITKEEMVALFYNNQAATALINQDYDTAYVYLKTAVQYSPYLDSIYGNLGVLYRFMGEYELAEKAYLRAEELEHDNYTAIENLALLYRKMGRVDVAESLEKRVNSARRNNPFYHFILGEEARSLGQYKEAMVHYQRALRLDTDNHQVLFGMGLSYYEQGYINEAKHYIGRAMKRSDSDSDRNRYNNKLALFQASIKSHLTLSSAQ